MADFRTLSLSITFAALVSFLISPPLSATAEQLATAVCKNTTDFAFCRSVLYSDPRAPVADRYELIDLIVRKAFRNAYDTRDYIAANLKSGGAGLKNCLRNYDKALQTLDEMSNDLNSDTYYELDVLSSDIERQIRACRKGLQRQRIVIQRTQNMLKLANICYVVSKLFEYNH